MTMGRALEGKGDPSKSNRRRRGILEQAQQQPVRCGAVVMVWSRLRTGGLGLKWSGLDGEMD